MNCETAGIELSLLSEADYDHEMKTVVLPYLEMRKEDGYLFRNGNLFYCLYRADQPKGIVVFCHGYTESGRKFEEMIYYFLKAGLHCAILDERGHGRSVREGKDLEVIHVRHFSDYEEDLHDFVHKIVKTKWENALPYYLFGHSMGGCIAARYLERWPQDFEKAILNAPMLGIRMEKCPLWAALLLCDFELLTGRGGHRLFFQKPYQPGKTCDPENVLFNRHNYYRKLRDDDKTLQTTGASYRWVREAVKAGKLARSEKEAGKITAKVLLFRAGEDTLVTSKAQDTFLNRISDGELIIIAGATHEIYRSCNKILEGYLKTILTFFIT